MGSSSPPELVHYLKDGRGPKVSEPPELLPEVIVTRTKQRRQGQGLTAHTSLRFSQKLKRKYLPSRQTNTTRFLKQRRRALAENRKRRAVETAATLATKLANNDKENCAEPQHEEQMEELLQPLPPEDYETDAPESLWGDEEEDFASVFDTLFHAPHCVSTGKEERDTIDGFEFLSFETEHDLLEFTKFDLDFRGVKTPPDIDSSNIDEDADVDIEGGNIEEVSESLDSGDTEAGIAQQPTIITSLGIVPTKTKDITKIKGWRTKQFLMNGGSTSEDGAFGESTVSSIEDELLEARSPPRPASCESKAAFVSDVLDEFLTKQAELKVSYEVPRLDAVEGISHRDSEDETQTVCLTKRVVEDTEEHARRMKRFRASGSGITVNHVTLSRTEHSDSGSEYSFTSSGTASRQRPPRLRPHKVPNYNEDSVDSESEGETENQHLNTRQLRMRRPRGRPPSRMMSKLTNSDRERSVSSSRWSRTSDGEEQLLNNIRKQGNELLHLTSATNIKKMEEHCTKTENGKHTFILKKGFEWPPKAAAVKVQMGTQAKSEPKNELEMDTGTEMSVSFVTGVGKQLPMPAQHQLFRMRSNTYHIDSHWARFATSVVLSANWKGDILPRQRIVLPLRHEQLIFPTPQPPTNSKELTPQNHKCSLMAESRGKRSWKKKEEENETETSHILTPFTSLPSSSFDPSATPLPEVRTVVADLLDYVCIREGGDRVNSDPDTIPQRAESPIRDTPLQVNLSRRVKPAGKSVNVLRELGRLGVSVIELGTESDSMSQINIDSEGPCGQPHCRLGCVCGSLRAGIPTRDHCGEPECMLSCSCPVGVSPITSTSPGHNRLLPSDVLKRVRASCGAGLRLAKEELEFRQTVISKPDQGLFVANERRRRERKLPGRYRDSVLTYTLPEIKALARSDEERAKSANRSHRDKEKQQTQPSPPQLQQLSLQQSQLPFYQPQQSAITRTITFAKSQEAKVSTLPMHAETSKSRVSLAADDEDLEANTGLNKNLEELRRRFCPYQCFVVVNKVKGHRRRPYCMEHDQYGCDCIRRRQYPSTLVELIRLNTAIRGLCSPPLKPHERRETVSSPPLKPLERREMVSSPPLKPHERREMVSSPPLKPHERRETVSPPIRQVAVKSTSRTHKAGSCHNVEKHTARTAGVAAKYLQKQIWKDASRDKDDADGSNGIQIAAVTSLSLEEFFKQKQQDQEQQQQEHQPVRPQRVDRQLGSRLLSLLRGKSESGDSLTQAIAAANVFPDLTLLPEGHAQVVSWCLLKNLLSKNEIFVWVRVLNNTLKVLVTNSPKQPYALFLNLKSMHRLQGLPLVVKSLVTAEDEAPGIAQNRYAILSCDGRCWEIAGTLTNNPNKKTEKSVITKDMSEKAISGWTSRNHGTNLFAELRASEDPISFRTRVLASLSGSMGGDMRFKLAQNVTVRDETAEVMAGDYVLPRGASKFHWFSVPLIRKYDVAYVGSKRCYIEFDEMEDMVFKAMRSKMALCKPLLERREGYASVNQLSCPKFGVYADFSVPGKLLFGPFTESETHRISLHRLVELPPKKSTSTSDNADSITSVVCVPPINSSPQPMKQLQAGSQRVPCVLLPMMPVLGYIEAVRNPNGSISFQHPVIKEQELTFGDIGAIDAWLDTFLQSRILYVPKQLRVKWKCIRLDCFDPTAKKPFDTHVLNGNHVMTVVGVFNLLEMRERQAASYGLKESLLHKLKEKLRRRDAIDGFNNLGRVLNSKSSSKHVSKQQLLNQAANEIKKLEANFVNLSYEKNQLKLEKQRLLKSLHNVISLSDAEEVGNIVEELNKMLERRDNAPVVEINDNEEEADQISSLNSTFGSISNRSNTNADNQETVIDISSSDSDLDDYLSEDEQSSEAEDGTVNTENGPSDIGISKESIVTIQENESAVQPEFTIQQIDDSFPNEIKLDAEHSDCNVVTIERVPADFHRPTPELFRLLKDKPVAKVALPVKKVIEVIEISDDDDDIEENGETSVKQSSDVTSGCENLLANIKRETECVNNDQKTDNISKILQCHPHERLLSSDTDTKPIISLSPEINSSHMESKTPITTVFCDNNKVLFRSTSGHSIPVLAKPVTVSSSNSTSLPTISIPVRTPGSILIPPPILTPAPTISRTKTVSPCTVVPATSLHIPTPTLTPAPAVAPTSLLIPVTKKVPSSSPALTSFSAPVSKVGATLTPSGHRPTVPFNKKIAFRVSRPRGRPRKYPLEGRVISSSANEVSNRVVGFTKLERSGLIITKPQDQAVRTTTLSFTAEEKKNDASKS